MQPIDTGTMTMLIVIALAIGLAVGSAGGTLGARLAGHPAWKGAAVPLASVLLPIPLLLVVHSPGALDTMLLQLLAAVLAGWGLKLGLSGTAGSIIGAIIAVGLLVVGIGLWNALVN